MLSNYLRQKLCEYLTKANNVAGGGANDNWSPPTGLSVSLHYGDPGTTGANELQTSGTGSDGYSPGYARKAHNPDADTSTNTNWNAYSSGKITNAAAVTFNAASGDWNQPTGGGSARTIGYCGLWDQSGNFLGGGPITTPRAVTNGATASFAVGVLEIDFTAGS